MNRTVARQIAETITNAGLIEMFKNAKESITDWNAPSIVNVGITKGAAWNVLAADFIPEHKYHILGRTNMVREFGIYLPGYSKQKKSKRDTTDRFHLEPIFSNPLWEGAK